MLTRPTHIVSHWVIPGGVNYHAAYINEVPAYSEEEAEYLASRIGEGPPEMAVVFTITEWYASRKKYRQRVAQQKQEG